MFRRVISLIRRFRERYRLSTYNDYTIAEHFRAQGAQIGNDCRILVRDFGSEPFLVRIGNHVTIAPQVVFVTHDGGTWVFTEQQPSLQKFSPIEILDNCFIGIHAVIMGNVRIGPNSIVAAGAVVTKDVPPNTVVGGCPAKPICTIEEYKQKAIAAWGRQRPTGYMTDLRDGVRYSAAEIQSRKWRDFSLLRSHLEKIFWKA
jgi:acetyltransferase-like isoleucine patch superfamily enzyme